MLLLYPFLFGTVAFASAVALAWVSRLRRERAARLGRVLHAELEPRRARALGLAALAAALVYIAVSGAWNLLVLGALLLGVLAWAWWLLPGVTDQRCGTDAVQYGCDTVPLEELGTWRLTGDHLRFRLRGLWVAVALPRALHEEMRARLVAACPEGESPFRD